MLLVCALALTRATIQTDNFPDVPENHWAYEPMAKGKGHAEPISAKLIKLIETERTAFFRNTKDLPGSGYRYGDLGSMHEILFPIGRSDVLYYVCNWVPMADDGDPSGGRFTVTKWRRTGDRYVKVWQLPFRADKRKVGLEGSMLRLIRSDWTVAPDTDSKVWPQAKKDLEAWVPYAVYHFGEHGDVSLQALAEVDNAKGRRVALEGLPRPTLQKGHGEYVDYPEGATLEVLPAEAVLLNAARGLGKQSDLK